MNSRDIIRELEAAGWFYIGATGSHHHFKHPNKPGKVTDGEVNLSPSRTEGMSAMRGYIALVHKDVGTSYGVSFPDVPGCISAGDTFEEAVANAAEALTGHFAAMRADGEVIPTPRDFEAVRADTDLDGAVVTVVSPKELAAAR